ncbi:MAG TPA: YidC/Oxa1 family insertase periplasmic-domain containing protein [Gemmatimonadaceae bacterium]|nr:YidC/Oxa1 family insertase periplasmic-domain containing protein [Gemmatimonadaceae bacterium]
MDRRTLFALVLMALVLVIVPRFFSPRRSATTAADSTAAADTSLRSSAASAAPGVQQPAASPAAAAPSAAAASPTPRRLVETVVSTGDTTRTVYANPGAVPVAVTMVGFRELRPDHHDSLVTVESPNGPLLHYHLALGHDTVALDTVHFAVHQQKDTTTFTSTSPALTLTYQSKPDTYLTNVRGTVANAPPGASLVIDLPSELRSAEADTVDDLRNLAFGYKIPLRDVTSIPFGKLDPNEVRADSGSMQWVAARNKYWLVALMKPVKTPPGGIFRGLTMRGGPRAGKIAPVAYATTAIGLENGQFAFDLYVGPQSLEVLRSFGNDLESVNPYAGILHAVVQPFSTITMRTLLWMKKNTHLSYGWVLVIFGVAIRVVLWPLYQRSMRTSLQMQRLQPELSEIQKRYKNEPDKQRDALVKVYQAHGMSPFSPMLGCLPMLLPMPILYALYFVLRSTIELRGVPFLWMPDLSLRDPYYITPIVMGLSMFVMSWIGIKAAPPNPQAKMMAYMMPAMFTLMFLNLSSGLNLYYAVQNIASLPQQLMTTRERAKMRVTTVPAPAARRT